MCYNIGEIFDLKKEDAIFLYEIYCENIQITKKLVDFFEIRNHLAEFKLLIPDFFVIDIEFNRKLELYIASLRGLKMNKKSLEILTETETTVNENGDESKSLKSVDDLSKILLQITTPNFKIIEKKEFFRPPVIKTEPTLEPASEEERKEFPKIIVNAGQTKPMQYLQVPAQTIFVGSKAKENVTFRGNDGTPIKNAGDYKVVLTHTPEGSREASFVSFVEGYGNENSAL